MIGNKQHSIETQIIVKGSVQGVFFRAKTKKYADALGLLGYVQNLPDGRVEICIAGESIDPLISKLKEEPSPIHIDSIEVTTRPCTQRYSSFNIR